MQETRYLMGDAKKKKKKNGDRVLLCLKRKRAVFWRLSFLAHTFQARGTEHIGSMSLNRAMEVSTCEQFHAVCEEDRGRLSQSPALVLNINTWESCSNALQVTVPPTHGHVCQKIRQCCLSSAVSISMFSFASNRNSHPNWLKHERSPVLNHRT